MRKILDLCICQGRCGADDGPLIGLGVGRQAWLPLEEQIIHHHHICSIKTWYGLPLSLKELLEEVTSEGGGGSSGAVDGLLAIGLTPPPLPGSHYKIMLPM